MATPARPPETTIAFREGTGETPSRPRTTPGEAFSLARAWVREGRQLDMAALAAELGVARGTLYRWAGDRHRLLADVVRADLDQILEHSWNEASGRGVQHLEKAASRFLDIVADQSAVRALLAHEGQAGLRMLTAPDGPIRPHLVERTAALIEQEVATGAYRPPAAPRILADGVISLGERFLHNGGDPALNPDPATAKTIVGLLLREPPA